VAPVPDFAVRHHEKWQSIQTVNFEPNPQRRHTRGRRGKVLTGISDLQTDFEEDRKEMAAARHSHKERDDQKKQRAAGKKWAERGLRHRVGRKVTKRGVVIQHLNEIHAEYVEDEPKRVQFTNGEKKERKKKFAASRRARLGMQGRRRRSNQKSAVSSSSPVVVRPMYQQFKRTGKLPSCSVQAIRDGQRDGVTADQLKQLINAMLVRGGIEENPGPPSVTSSTLPDSAFDEEVIDVDEKKPKTAKWRPKQDCRGVDVGVRCRNCGQLGHNWKKCPERRNKAKMDKERGKYTPTHKGRVDQAQRLDQQKADGEKMGDRELAQEKKEKEQEKKKQVRDPDAPRLQDFTVRYGDCMFKSAWKVAYMTTLTGDFSPFNQQNDKVSAFDCITTNALKVISLIGTVSVAALAARYASKSGVSSVFARVVSKLASIVGMGGAGVVAKKAMDHFHVAKGRVRTYEFERPVHCTSEELVGGLAPNPQLSDPVDPHFRRVKVTDHVFSEESYLGFSIPRTSTYEKVVTISETLFALLLQKSVRLRNKTRAEVVDSLSLFADGYKDVPIPLGMETGRRCISAETVDVVADWLTSSPAWSLGGQESALTY